MDDLKLIKDKYGENMAHLCRTLFQSVLKNKGVLFNFLSEKFHYSRNLYNDLIKYNLVDKFQDFVLSTLDNRERKLEEVNRTPAEILALAGYRLFECKTESDIQAFKRYYDVGEELCTFDGNRLDTCYVFFAVKNNALRLDRRDFYKPEREDEYGTSVISIQFKKGKNNYVSIKNRYNHTVQRPDATYENELDDIGGIVTEDGTLDQKGKCAGLAASFAKYYGYKIENDKVNLRIPSYTTSVDGKNYRYNYEINNIHYCGDNVIIYNGQVQENILNKDNYLLFDYFTLDLHKKKIILHDTSLVGYENFAYTINQHEFDKISIIKDKKSDSKEITLSNDEGKIVIGIDKNSNIVSYYDDLSKSIGSNFLKYSTEIKSVDLPKVETIGSDFLDSCNGVDYFNAPELKEVGNRFMRVATHVQVSAPKLEKAGNSFLNSDREIEEIELNNLTTVGNFFLTGASNLRKAKFEKLKSMGDYSLDRAESLEKLEAPNLETVGINSLRQAHSLTDYSIPKLKPTQKALKGNENLQRITNQEYINVTQQSNYMNPYDNLSSVHVSIGGGRRGRWEGLK